jgi:hypothetical protein
MKDDQHPTLDELLSNTLPPSPPRPALDELLSDKPLPSSPLLTLANRRNGKRRHRPPFPLPPPSIQSKAGV